MSSAPLTGRLVAGRYRIGSLLGEGGMGAVYEAVQEDLGRPVAIKVMHENLQVATEALARFQREAKAAASLGHPNIAQVTDFGADEGRAYLVMDRLPGASLASILEREGRLSPDRACGITVQLLSALEAAHGAGFVTFAGYAEEALSIVDPCGRLACFTQSDTGSTRRFCSRCGTQLLFAGERWAGEVHVAVAALDAVPGMPTVHAYADRAPQWCPITDELPQYGGPEGNAPL